MNTETTNQGSLHISPRAIASVVHQATLQTYGVVGLAAKNLFKGLANVLVRDPAHGVEVTFKDGRLTIDIYLIVEYGTRIKSVAVSVATTVKYQVEKVLALPVGTINIHVQGLRISEEG